MSKSPFPIIEAKGFFRVRGETSIITVKNRSDSRLFSVRIEDDYGIVLSDPVLIYVCESLEEIGFIVRNRYLTQSASILFTDDGGRRHRASINWNKSPLARRRPKSATSYIPLPDSSDARSIQ